MGILDKLGDFIAPEEDDEEYEMIQDDVAVSPYEKSTLKESSNITENTSIVIFEPRTFDEAEEIGFHIKSKRACCVNLHRLPSEYRQRIIDFLSGVIYGVDGSIKKLGENVILCSPKNLQVGGEINLNTEEY